MKGLRLYKIEKLCSPVAVDLLFSRGAGSSSAISYPWRAVWRVNPDRSADIARFLISVPKKRLRHAVDRVTMRRRCREAYRLNRSILPGSSRLDIAFIYVADGLLPYDRSAHAVKRLLGIIARSLKSHSDNNEPAE